MAWSSGIGNDMKRLVSFGPVRPMHPKGNPMESNVDQSGFHVENGKREAVERLGILLKLR